MTVATFGFQTQQVQALLSAKPFRPFEVYLIGHKADWRIDTPKGARMEGDVLVIRDDGVESWIPLAAISLIRVEG